MIARPPYLKKGIACKYRAMWISDRNKDQCTLRWFFVCFAERWQKACQAGMEKTLKPGELENFGLNIFNISNRIFGPTVRGLNIGPGTLVHKIDPVGPSGVQRRYYISSSKTGIKIQAVLDVKGASVVKGGAGAGFVGPASKLSQQTEASSNSQQKTNPPVTNRSAPPPPAGGGTINSQQVRPDQSKLTDSIPTTAKVQAAKQASDSSNSFFLTLLELATLVLVVYTVLNFEQVRPFIEGIFNSSTDGSNSSSRDIVVGEESPRRR
eukprot:CAMPEP_0174974284 /NCGR_PEP_ID=MMETSP0004_2-20121128/11744_1 /TAXON_ID=420556 /ORGANISM="Ochromonas sp., Strain CCMP1393" /LENGTH=265 /DNA_ID=CAMNT_0016224891 /DNA_START=237 /DNA_END=1034 /DNA_ORIENTATION=-